MFTNVLRLLFDNFFGRRHEQNMFATVVRVAEKIIDAHSRDERFTFARSEIDDDVFVLDHLKSFILVRNQ